MDESYFDYTIDEISIFSRANIIKSLKRRFRGYPFDEKSKEIIAKVTEKKYLIEQKKTSLEERSEKHKKGSKESDYRTGPISYRVIELRWLISYLTLIVASIIILFHILQTSVSIDGVFKYFFILLNVTGGIVITSYFYKIYSKVKWGNKIYNIISPLSLFIFFTSSVYCFFILKDFRTFLYIAVIPFFLIPISSIFFLITFIIMRIILNITQVMEANYIKNNKAMRLKKIKEERKNIEQKIVFIDEYIQKTQEKLSSKIEIIKDLSQKYNHIFFPFNILEQAKEYEIVQANLAIAIGEYNSGLEIMKNLLGEKIEKYPAYLYWQSICSIDREDFSGAYKYLNKCLSILSSPDILTTLCFLHIKSNNSELVEEEMKREPLLSLNTGEKFFLKALACFSLNNFDQAELAFNKSLSLKPDDLAFKIMFISSLLKAKEYKKLYGLVKEFDMNNTKQRYIRELFSGAIEYEQKNYKKAMDYFNEISKKFPDDIEVICYREMSKGQRKIHPFFREKNMAQKLINRLPDGAEELAVTNYSIAKLLHVEGHLRPAIEYLEKSYLQEENNSFIITELSRFYLSSPFENNLRIEVILKSIPLMKGKKRFFRKILDYLLAQKDVHVSILKLLEEQFFKNINYDPLMVKILARHYLKKERMDEKGLDIYLKALDLNCLEEEEKVMARKFIAWYDAENGLCQMTREILYKNLLLEHPEDERILFLNALVLCKKGQMADENLEVFKNILGPKYVNSRFWSIFDLNRDYILINLIKYYREKKIYNEENGKIIEEAFDKFPRDRLPVFTFGEYCIKMEKYNEKALIPYREMYREDQENSELLIALGKTFMNCNIINIESVSVLEKVFIKNLIWNEAIVAMTKYYIQKMTEGKLKKELIVLFVWGRYTELEPEDYNVRFYIAEELFLRKDYLQASQKYEEVISLCPEHRDALFSLGDCYLNMDKLKEGTEIFKKIIKQKDDIDSLKKLASIYIDIYKEPEEALIYYEKIIALDGKNVEILKILLELYKKERNLENMIRIQEKITILEPSGENFATLGHFYLRTNRLEDGIDKLEEAINRGFAARGKVYAMMAEAKYCMVNDKSSRDDWLNLINIISEAINHGVREKKLYEMRYQAYLKIDDRKKAAEDKRIFAPDDLDNLYNLANEWRDKNDITAEKENLMQIYRKDRDFLDVSMRLARIFSLDRSLDSKHKDIIIYAFSSNTNYFLRQDEDEIIINHLHNYFRLNGLFQEEIDFLCNVLKHKHPYNEGKLRSWISIDLIEMKDVSKAYEILDNIPITDSKEELLEANIRLAEELLFKESFGEGESILEKIYLIDPTYKNVGILLENLRKERLGRFALLNPVGSGANATVYKAFDLVTRNFVAVKSLHSDLNSDKEAVGNFKKEYEILEEMIHPGVAKVIPGSFNNNFFALELLDKSLANLLEENKSDMELNEFFNIIMQIVETLHYMHSKNIIYHDLAPDNIMFSGDMVKFCDLGGAKRFDLKTRQTIVASTEKHYLYASPEQCRYEFDPSVKVDNRSDIYSLGVLMYHMLCGVPPFTGPDQALISAHQHSVPSPVLSQKDNIPRQLIGIIYKAIEKKPEDRYQSMEELRQSLLKTPRI